MAAGATLRSLATKGMHGLTATLIPTKLQQMLRLLRSRRRSASRWRQNTVSLARVLEKTVDKS